MLVEARFWNSILDNRQATILTVPDETNVRRNTSHRGILPLDREGALFVQQANRQEPC